MARVFIEGFELRHLQNWDQIHVDSKSTSNATAWGLSGGYCLNFPNVNNYINKQLTDADEYYVSARVYLPSAGATEFLKFYNGTTILGRVGLAVNSGNNHVYINAGGSTYYGSLILDTGLPYRIEVRFKASTSNTGNFQVKVNGVLDIDKTSTVTSTNTTTIDKIYFNSVCDNMKLDDIVIDNAQWPGNTRIQQLMPDGSGTSTQWTPSAVDNYDCVNDLSTTITSVDADYIYASTVNALDAYAMAALVEGSNPISEIKCIQVTARAKIDGTCSANAVKLKVITTSATYESAVTQIQEDAWAHYTYLKSDTANITTAHMANISIGLATTKV